MIPFRKASLPAAVAAQCLFAGLAATSQAQAGQIPDYFFSEWTVATNCTEQHAGLAASAATGLQFQITRDTSADGNYFFQALDNDQAQWAANWNGMKLVYRPGTQLTTVPADFECIPGQESSSPFLAMSGFAQASEPYYEQEHWYGLANIQGQLEHVLIFPRNASTGPAAIIVMESVNAPGTVQLDDDGVIHAQH
jgi:hypothetical protein